MSETTMPDFKQWAYHLAHSFIAGINASEFDTKTIEQALQQAFDQGIAYGVREAVTTDKWKGVF